MSKGLFQIFIMGKKKNRTVYSDDYSEARAIVAQSKAAGNAVYLHESIGPDFYGGPDIYAACTRGE